MSFVTASSLIFAIASSERRASALSSSLRALRIVCLCCNILLCASLPFHIQESFSLGGHLLLLLLILLFQSLHQIRILLFGLCCRDYLVVLDTSIHIQCTHVSFCSEYLIVELLNVCLYLNW